MLCSLFLPSCRLKVEVFVSFNSPFDLRVKHFCPLEAVDHQLDSPCLPASFEFAVSGLNCKHGTRTHLLFSSCRLICFSPSERAYTWRNTLSLCPQVNFCALLLTSVLKRILTDMGPVEDRTSFCVDSECRQGTKIAPSSKAGAIVNLFSTFSSLATAVLFVIIFSLLTDLNYGFKHSHHSEWLNHEGHTHRHHRGNCNQSADRA